MKTFSERIQMYSDCHGKFKVGRRIYERIARYFLFNLIPEELLYVKNTNSGRIPKKISICKQTTKNEFAKTFKPMEEFSL
jgi:hypothetical protein